MKVSALVMKTLINLFFIELARAARMAEKELGVSLVVKTAAQALTRQMTEPTQVAIFEGVRKAINAIKSKDGALRAIKPQPLAELAAMDSAHCKIASKDCKYDKRPNFYLV